MNAYQIKLTDADFEDILGREWSSTEICGFVYAPGKVFRRVDPKAFYACKAAVENTGEWFCSACAVGYASEDAAEICCQENTLCNNCHTVVFPNRAPTITIQGRDLILSTYSERGVLKGTARLDFCDADCFVAWLQKDQKEEN